VASMSWHEPFGYHNSGDLLRKAEDLGVELPFQEGIQGLFDAMAIGSKSVPNRLAVQPMEGYDSNPDGSPGELTFRRYGRYAAGGSGLIWFEATSVVREGRSNPRQLMLCRDTVDGFKRLVECTRQSAHRAFGNQHDPFLVIQLTHSGRYSRPEGKLLGKVGCPNPHLDQSGEDIAIFSDDELDRLRDRLVEAVGLARQAGFDGVDIKACHGYLVHELLGAYNRGDSRYGGIFENRSRLLLEVMRVAGDQFPDMVMVVRLSCGDGIPYPYGFGAFEDGSGGVDLREPKVLIRQLIEDGCRLLNVTVGIPTHAPHWVRPFDRAVPGEDVPEEHPLQGVARLINVTGELQREFPGVPFVGTGYSWLRQFAPKVGAAAVQRGMVSLMGLGRSSLAYPDAPKDLMETGAMDPKKTCITCSRCTELMRQDRPVGCVMRDKDIYAAEYKEING
jgi:2,4-dienoyl-CoA reductase (NADPH2)